MRPFRARALKKIFLCGEQPRQRGPGLENPKRQMPSCRTQPENLRAPRGAGAPCGLRAPTRKVTTLPYPAPSHSVGRAGEGAAVRAAQPTRKVTRPVLAGAPLNSQSCAPPGAPAPRVASAPQPAKLQPFRILLPPTRWGGLGSELQFVPLNQPEKLQGQASRARTSTRNLARPPGRRRPVWHPRPNPQSYNPSVSCSLPLRGEGWGGGCRSFGSTNPQSYTARPRGRAPQLAILRAPRGASAPCGLRAQPAKLHPPVNCSVRSPEGAAF